MIARQVCRAAMLLATVVWASPGYAANIVLSCGSVGQETRECQDQSDIWAKQTGNTVKVLPAPTSATERLALYQQYLAAGSTDIDVYEIDVIWPGVLADHLEDLSGKLDKATLAANFPSIIANNTVRGKLVAIPFFTDAGLLYYRSDLLQKYHLGPPKTWEELTAEAQKVQAGERAAGHPEMQGFVWQGKAYEGLTVDALEWIASSNGGTIVDPDGKITIDNPNAAKAVDLAAGWVGKISPEGVLNYAEEESRGVFQSGNAVFMRNWPYAWSLSQGADSPVRGKVGVAALPAGEGGQSAAVLGGWQMAVSKYSKHKDAAIDLAKFLCSEPMQKWRAIHYSQNPTIAALYKDPDVLKANPFYGSLFDVFTHTVARPSRVAGTRYAQLSAAFQTTVHDVLAAGRGAAPKLAALRRQLERISRNGHW
jgi:trehalose/maltose transport system substrate-binding protein